MDKLIIDGPAKLSGEVQISKAKNAYLPIITAVLLSEKPVTLKNVPNLRDIRTIFKLLENLGVKVEKLNEKDFKLDASNITSLEATYDLVKTMRASILVLGPLLTRFGQAKVSLPGGCAIGARPIDIHLSGLEKLGANISLEGGYVEATAKGGLVGNKIVLSFPSVGATENLLMAASFAKGETIIENAALEPEITDLVHFLQVLGVKINGIGTTVLKIQGIEPGQVKEIEYEAIGDRIEAATYIIAGLITESQITVKGFDPEHLDAVIEVLREMGAKLEVGKNSVEVFPSKLKGGKISTTPFPGFPTDVQAQMIALATQAGSASIVKESIFENRFMHVPELIRLGADIILEGHSAFVSGRSDLLAAPVMCTDLRASAALVLAALKAKGKTEIHRVYHLDRGYDRLDEKLIKLGVKIERVNE